MAADDGQVPNPPPTPPLCPICKTHHTGACPKDTKPDE